MFRLVQLVVVVQLVVDGIYMIKYICRYVGGCLVNTRAYQSCHIFCKCEIHNFTINGLRMVRAGCI